MRLLNNLETFLGWLSSYGVGSDIASYCHLETAYSDDTLVTTDASLLTLIDLEGALQIVGDDEFAHIRSTFARALSSYLAQGGHSLQFVFERDPEMMSRKLDEALEGAILTSRRLGLDCDDIFSERKRTLMQECAHESNLIALYTHPSTLSKDEMKRELGKRRELLKKSGLPAAAYGQRVLLAMRSMVHRHQSLKESFMYDLKSKMGLVAKVLNAHDAARAVRAALDAEFTANDWRPRLPGDPMPIRGGHRQDDMSDLLWPKLSFQVAPRKVLCESDTLKVGRRFMKVMMMELGPQEPLRFMELFRKINSEIPWRVSFTILPNGFNYVKVKQLMVSFLAIASDVNKDIKRSLTDLEGIAKGGDPAVALKVCAMIWAYEEDELERRFSTLARAIQGWGVCDTTDDVGDPLAGLSGCLPGFSDTNIANSLPAPLSDVVTLLPLDRPASIWGNGSMLFHSDSKLYPYQPGSGKQDAWNDIIFAPMGSGKSGHLNVLNFATCTAPGLNKLPYITNIDVGPSSLGVVSLLKSSLPDVRKHEVGYFKLSMSADYAINPFDTQLGCRYPTAMEREFLICLFIMLATPIGETKPYAGACDLAGMVVDEIYKQFSDAGTTRKKYEDGLNIQLDDVLSKTGFAVDAATSWWEVTDAFMRAGMVHEAHLAQRYAMPTLSDVPRVLNSSIIRDTFARSEGSTVRVSSGESLLDAMTRVISTSLKDYSVISSTTRFDISACRVVSLDLDDVARGGGEAGKKQAAIMFMLARQLAAKNYYCFRKDEPLPHWVPELYHAYHADRSQTMLEQVKAIRYDEFHRTGGMEAIRNLVLLDMREGRKWNVHVSLASQFLTDFPDDILKAAYSIYILKGGSEQLISEIRDIFKLSHSAVERLRIDVTGPGPRGANLLAIFNTKIGNVMQVITSSPGAIERWAYSTTAEDVTLRDLLYKRVGQKKARAMLADRFPGGSAKDEIERRKFALGKGEAVDVIARLVDELVASDAKQAV
jgi:intracellular multiplication protein IcmB